MQLAIYGRLEPIDTVVLTPVIFSPPVEARHAHGPLILHGTLDTDEGLARLDLDKVLGEIDERGYAVVDREACLPLWTPRQP